MSKLVDRRNRPHLIIALSILLYITFALTLHERAGDGVVVLSLVPATIFGWFYGARRGFWAGIVAFPINVGLLWIASGGWPTSFLTSLIGYTGSGFVVISATVTGYLSSLNKSLKQEIAKQAQIAIELRDGQEQYRVIAETSSDAIIQIDAESNILFANKAVEKTFGYERNELRDNQLTILMPETFRSRHKEGVARFLATNKRSLGWEAVELVGLHKDGHEFPIEVSFSHLAKHGESQFIGYIRDITERKQSEEILRRTHKLESLGVLAGGIAHDFNNLLVAMTAQNEIAIATLPANSRAATHIEKALMSAERASDLTRQLLAYSGRGRYELSLVDWNKLILDNTQLFSVTVPKNVQLERELTRDLPLIYADESQMQQLVMNLIINGAESIGERTGQVLVCTGRLQIPENDQTYSRFTGKQLKAGDYVCISVQDDGSGMSAETISAIFDPFFSTKFAGRGLGLAAALGIIQAHDGGLNVESELGKGTLITLLFPVSESQAAPDVLPHPNGAAGEGLLSGRLLLVDDEQSVLESVIDVLSLTNIEVHAVDNGQEAVEIFAKEQSRFDAVLLDLSMPGLSGHDVFIKLRAMRADLPIVISSGFSESEVAARYDGYNHVGFLRKPYKIKQLLDALGQFMPKITLATIDKDSN